MSQRALLVLIGVAIALCSSGGLGWGMPGSGDEGEQRLLGRWELEPVLSRRLSGQLVAAGAGGIELKAGEASSLEDLPPEARSALGTRKVLLTGWLVLGGSPQRFALTESGSGRELVFFPLREGGRFDHPVSLGLHLVVANTPLDDLLILRQPDSGGQVLVYERAGNLAAHLSPLSRALLEAAVDGVFADAVEARELLPRRPDWQAVADALLQAIDREPTGFHNNGCLTLAGVAEAHLNEIALDLGPLLAALRTPSWTNQQKCGQVLAVLAARPQLFGGKEQAAAEALVRLTLSQRGRVVAPALAALNALTGEQFGRDPTAWAAWFEEQYGVGVDLEGAVYEQVVILRQTGTDNGQPLYELGGSEVGDLSAVEHRLRELAAATPLPLSVAVVVTQKTVDAGLGGNLAPNRKLLELLQGLPLSAVTLAPETDVFYPPIEARSGLQ